MGVSWIKKGAEAAALQEQAKAEQQAKKDSYDKLFRFWMKEGEEKDITFVDGKIDKETGLLDAPRLYEHKVQLNGEWTQLVCPEKSDPKSGHKCPICKSGDTPTLVAGFTIIDHSEFTSAKGNKYKDTQKLFVATSKTYELLNKFAQKMGGSLVGQRFSVSRTSDKAPRVGDVLIPGVKTDPEVLAKMYVREWVDKEGVKKIEPQFVVADYETEFTFKTPDELAKLGFGGPAATGVTFTTSTPKNEEASAEYKNLL